MKSHCLTAWLLLTATALAQDRGPLDLATASVPPGAQRIAYGSDPLQFGELRVPKTGSPHPLAIVVHGGCWLAQIGNMDRRAVSIDYMRPAAAALTDAGIATWSIEYRRLGNDGGGWPGTFKDVANAADFVRTFAQQQRLDLARSLPSATRPAVTSRSGSPRARSWRRRASCMRAIR